MLYGSVTIALTEFVGAGIRISVNVTILEKLNDCVFIFSTKSNLDETTLIKRIILLR